MIRIILLLITFLLIYTGGHILVYRLYRSVFKMKKIRIIFFILIFFSAYLFIASHLLENYLPSSIVIYMNVWGSFWFAVISYLFLFTIFYYFLHLLHIIHRKYFDKEIDILRIREYYVLVTIVFLVVLIFVGYRNAVRTEITRIELETNDYLPNGKLKIVMAADIHAGYIIRHKMISKLVNIVNNENTDLFLIPGDIFDGNIDYVIENDLYKSFLNIITTYGTYVSLGNHDNFSNPVKISDYLSKRKVNVLDDNSVIIKNIEIIGRKDLSSNRRNKNINNQRKLLKELKNRDNSLYTILLDHQPYGLENAEKNMVDLQVSGHTHNGQFWPYSIITNLIYEKSWGYLKKSDTSYYVTCGYGTWGPFFRLGSHSEIVVITVKSNFNKGRSENL